MAVTDINRHVMESMFSTKSGVISTYLNFCSSVKFLVRIISLSFLSFCHFSKAERLLSCF